MEIRLDHLEASWKDFRLTVNTVIPGGKLTALLGPSGAGKSTLLHLITGFLKPERGRILAGGRDITGLPPHKRKVGLVFQDYALFPHLTVRDNIAYGAGRGKDSRDTRNQRISELASLLELIPLLNRKPATLSGGERQRTALGRALASSPDLLLLDEPFSALDPSLRGTLREELLKVQRKTGVTTLLVTHDQNEALSMADHLLLFHNGQIVEEGSPERLYGAPEHPFTARFLGTGNFIPLGGGESLFFRPEDLVREGEPRRHGVTEKRNDVGGEERVIPRGGRVARSRGIHGYRVGRRRGCPLIVTDCHRFYKDRVGEPQRHGDTEGRGERIFSGTVQEIRFFGDRSMVTVLSDSGDAILWQTTGREAPKSGERIRLVLKEGYGRRLTVPQPPRG